MKERSNKIMNFVLVVLLMVLCFFLGRSFGFKEASEAYEPVIEKAQTVISDLRDELDRLYEYFEGVDKNESTDSHGTSA